VVLNAGLVVAFVAIWANLVAMGAFWRADFSAFYFGGRMVLEGDGPRLYDRETQGEYQARYWPERGGSDALLGFVYPPQDAVLFVPFALLDRTAAYLAWTVFNLGLLVLFVRFVDCAVAKEAPAIQAVVVVAALAFPPLFMTFQLGQLSLVSVVALLGFFAALRDGRQTTAGAWLVLSSVKPQLMIVPGLILLAGRRWRALAVAASLFALWAAVATWVLGHQCWGDFLATLAHCARQFGTYGIHPLRMYNCKGPLTAWFGSDQGDRINLLTTALSLGAMMWTFCLWCRSWPNDRWTFAVRAALVLLVGLVTNPHLNPADALAYLVPAVVLLAGLPRSAPRSPVMILALVAPLLFLIDSFALENWPGGVRPFLIFIFGCAIWLIRGAVLRNRMRINTGATDLHGEERAKMN
jgi:hypothetical protein